MRKPESGVATESRTTTMESHTSELVVGLVGAVGTDLAFVERSLSSSLERAGWTPETVEVSKLLHEFRKWEQLKELVGESERLEKHMNAGNEFREITGKNDAMALLSVAAIRQMRKKASGDQFFPPDRHAYLIKSLKRPEEVDLLREVYGDSLVLVAAYSPRENRVQALSEKIRRGARGFDSTNFRDKAETFVSRDEQEEGIPFGQYVRKTFPAADFFVDVSATPEETKIEIDRFVRLFFGDTLITPTPHEYCMAMARLAALRSGDLSRQVGAVIATKEGEVVSVGMNEVPKAGGGCYWAGDDPDGRDLKRGGDSSVEYRRNVLAELLGRLRDSGSLSDELSGLDIVTVVERALELDGEFRLGDTRLMNLLEFCRAVHAEMNALMQASRLGTPVKGTVLYSTTLPCHECARHIVAAGVEQVFYIEPYAKSLAGQLYPNEIALEEQVVTGKVVFKPFVGVAPSLFSDVFSKLKRKNDGDGTVLEWTPSTALPRRSRSSIWYITNENRVIKFLNELVDNTGLEYVEEGHRND